MPWPDIIQTGGVAAIALVLVVWVLSQVTGIRRRSSENHNPGIETSIRRMEERVVNKLDTLEERLSGKLDKLIEGNTQSLRLLERIDARLGNRQ